MKPAQSNADSLLPDTYIKVRNSKVHGNGVFAARKIPAGARIIEYQGKRISEKQAEKRFGQDPENPHHTFFFSLESGKLIDGGDEGNDARWINHSCEPNCEAQVGHHKEHAASHGGRRRERRLSAAGGCGSTRRAPRRCATLCLLMPRAGNACAPFCRPLALRSAITSSQTPLQGRPSSSGSGAAAGRNDDGSPPHVGARQGNSVALQAVRRPTVRPSPRPAAALLSRASRLPPRRSGSVVTRYGADERGSWAGAVPWKPAAAAAFAARGHGAERAMRGADT